MTEETGWRQKLEALRERPKPLVLQPKKSQLVPYGLPSSPVPRVCTQKKGTTKNSSERSSRSRSPDGSTGESRRRHREVKLVNVAGGDQKDCSQLLAVLSAANQKESVRHVTTTTTTSGGSYVLDGPAELVPECLNTFSDFYNPSVSAEERFEKYLAEMRRREREVAAGERLRMRDPSIGGFHYRKKVAARPRPLNGRTLPPTPRSSISGGGGGGLGALGDGFGGPSRFVESEGGRLGDGRAHSKKPLAISTFSLLDIDKMRHKDGFGLPHTTR